MSYYSEPNPYHPPDRFAPSMAGMPPPGFPPPTPGVWYCYVVYCLLMAVLYLFCLVGGGAMIAFADEIAAQDSSPNAAMEVVIVGAVLAVMGGALLLMYGIAPLLPKTKGAWIYGFVTIGLGMTSACTLPFCIGLLIFWLQPKTRAFFKAG